MWLLFFCVECYGSGRLGCKIFIYLRFFIVFIIIYVIFIIVILLFISSYLKNSSPISVRYVWYVNILIINSFTNYFIIVKYIDSESNTLFSYYYQKWSILLAFLDYFELQISVGYIGLSVYSFVTIESYLSPILSDPDNYGDFSTLGFV